MADALACCLCACCFESPVHGAAVALDCGHAYCNRQAGRREARRGAAEERVKCVRAGLDVLWLRFIGKLRQM